MMSPTVAVLFISCLIATCHVQGTRSSTDTLRYCRQIFESKQSYHGIPTYLSSPRDRFPRGDDISAFSFRTRRCFVYVAMLLIDSTVTVATSQKSTESKANCSQKSRFAYNRLDIDAYIEMRRTIRQLLLSAWWIGLASASLKIPFLSRTKKYTPLVFFTVPKDIIPECDAMEKIVSEVERELGVHVERLDVARDATAEATMSTLTQRLPPFLYHRESCQVVFAPGSSDSKKASPPIDKSRVRAWAKGRIITAQSVSSSAKSKAPVVVAQEDNSIDQKDLIEDATLSPMQKSGKEKMKERTKELGKDKK